MNLRLAVASVYLPGVVKRRKLAQLLRRTAGAFGDAAPDVTGVPFDEGLRTFAALTTRWAEDAARSDAGAADRLRATAREFGKEVRHALRIRTPADAMRAARLLYGMLGIRLEARVDGTLVIRRCYFADWYTPRVCALMSALDEGVLAGLAGGGQLAFASRITEGCDRCTATFRFEGGRA